MKAILFAELPNKKVAKMVIFNNKELNNYQRICNKNHYKTWLKYYKTHEELEKELTK